jgi:hypothetical protein
LLGNDSVYMFPWQPNNKSIVSNGVSTKAEDIVGIRCQAMLSEDIEDLMCAIVNCRVGEFVIALIQMLKGYKSTRLTRL